MWQMVDWQTSQRIRKEMILNVYPLFDTKGKDAVVKHVWFKVFKNGRSKICGRQPLKNHFKFFKGSHPQNLLGPFLNTRIFHQF